MEKQALISVIVPVYKVEKYLHRCVDSILAQTYQNLEIILVDDGSPDNCGSICDQYAQIDSRIRVIHQENGGLSAARNAGLDIATGEYIAFVDSDDYIQDTMFERLYECAKRQNADYVGCGYDHVSENGSILGTYTPEEESLYTGTDALRRHYSGTPRENYVTAWGKIYKRHIFNTLRYKVGIIFEDVHLMPSILMQCSTVAFIPYTGYVYIKHENSITNTQNTMHRFRAYKDSFTIWQEHLYLYERMGAKDLILTTKTLWVEKLIAHKVAGDIPADVQYRPMLQFKHYLYDLLLSKISLKHKARYLCIAILGIDKYKKLCNL